MSLPMPNKLDQSIRERIDDILIKAYSDGRAVERGEKPTTMLEQLRDELITLYTDMCQRIIGEDEPDEIMNKMLDPAYRDSRNKLRAEQRKHLQHQLSVARREEG